MSNERQLGFTLVEIVVAIVVISVGLAGVMMAFTQSVRGSADPVVRKQMLIIAEEMLEEAELKTFAGQNSTPPTTCARSGFKHVMDYNGYPQASPKPNHICDIDGNKAIDGFTVSVTVVPTTLGGVTSALLITVTVTAVRGNDSLTLYGWRTGYAS